MTAHASIVAAGYAGIWDKATHEVNAWRGEAIHHFTKAELAVSETLEVLATQPNTGAKVRLRRLVGQRFDDLATALSDAEAVKTDKAAKALAEFRTFEDLRPLLCHGADKIALDRNRQWIVIFKLVDMRGSGTIQVCRAFEERDARELLVALSKAAAELASSLQSVRDKFRSAAHPR